MNSLRRICLVLLLIPLCALAAGTTSFDIPAQPLPDALRTFAVQTRMQLLYKVEAVSGGKSNAVVGEYDRRAALEKLLKGTGFEVVFTRENAATIRPVRGSDSTASAQMKAVSLAQAGEVRPAGVESAAAQAAPAPASDEDMVVLGSRLGKSDKYGPSPVISYDLEEIRATGAMTVADFLSKLPQTYGGISAGRGGTPNELNLEYGQRNEYQTPLIPAQGTSPVLTPLAQTGVSGVSLRSLGAGSTLVLVDGRRVAQSGNGNRSTTSGQGFVDLNTIPLGQIERIEVITDGASAIYGADAVAGVVNIILKKNWAGAELASTVKFTQDGGAGERQATLTSGFGGTKLRGTVSVDYYERSPLLASQRDFTANMDHRNRIRGYDANGNALYGDDHRIQFGTASAMQALADGGWEFNDFPGVYVLLTPEGALTTPAVQDFQPRTTVPEGQTFLSANGQRAFNPAPYVQLVPESRRHGLMGNATYVTAGGMEAYGTLSYSSTRGYASGLPPYNNSNDFEGLVPAAYTPFGQNVALGMVHIQFGTESQLTETDAYSLTAGLRGQLRGSWRWDLGSRWQRQDFSSVSRRFNRTGMNAVFADPDPAQRLNPFIDYGAPGAPDVSALYERRLAMYSTVEAISEMTALDFTATGDMFVLPGGAVRAAFGFNFEQPSVTNSTVNPTGGAVNTYPPPTRFSERRESGAVFGELSVPLIGEKNARPGLRRLELQLAGRLEDSSNAERAMVPKVGFSWTPVRSLMLRASYSEGFRPPSLTEDQTAEAVIATVFPDPRRNEVAFFNRRNGSNPDLRPETSTNEFFGLVWEPAFADGLNLQVNYYRTRQQDAIQLLSHFLLIQNEALFPDRVIRNAPTAQDIAAGLPGTISEVITSAVNFGEVRNESMDFIAEYRLPWERFGRWRVSANVSHTLESMRAITPGGPPVDDVGDTYAGPKWKGLAALYWNRGPWSASMSASYLSSFKTNNAGYQTLTWSAATPSVRKFDARAGYVVDRDIWRGLGEGLRFDLSVENLMDEEPPFMNVMYGYNMGLHSDYVRGRTWGLSLVLPF